MVLPANSVSNHHIVVCIVRFSQHLVPKMTYTNTVEEGLKEFDENVREFVTLNADILQIRIERNCTIDSARLRVAQDNLSSQANDLIENTKSFLTTFAQKIREGIVEEVEKYDRFQCAACESKVPNHSHTQFCLFRGDLLAQLKDK